MSQALSYLARRRESRALAAAARLRATGGFVYGPIGASVVGILIGIGILFISLMNIGLGMIPGIVTGIGVIVLSLGILFMRVLWIILSILIILVGVVFIFSL